MNNRYICIHGHFYQPPRENPWLEAIERQDSAFPFHDWNERITSECYGPNGASRILDGDNQIVRISNNYSHMSFNFGPTLLSWMQAHAPSAYQRLIEADRESVERFNGHGSALAQCYNHLIMPLADRRDKVTQVRWGIKDFVHRFGRQPEGMWLPETAVDTETLEVLADEGIRFTILSPYQAKRVRPIGTTAWTDVGDGRVDPKQPYRVCLSADRSIDVFFYDGPISRGVAFDSLLHNGEDFARRLIGAFSDDTESPQLVHIATDGETYGHHQRFGDMALAYALSYIEERGLAQLTNYGEYLEHRPPTSEAEIVEKSAWSCAHGIERWRSNCGCHTGGQGGWTQAWRAPLRAALRRLHDSLVPQFETEASRLLRDPWVARDDYISVILDRSPENVDEFLARHSRRKLSEADQVKVLKLMEMQRNAMLMFTSCGWFFSELSGIETVQILQYAGRAVELAQDIFGDHVETRFLQLLGRAKSNIPEFGDGAKIYDRLVRPSVVDLHRLTAHYAVDSLFEEYGESSRLYCYQVQCQLHQRHEAGKARAVLGRAQVCSELTRESGRVSYAALHLGDHNLSVGVRDYRSDGAFASLGEEFLGAFDHADLTDALRALDRNFTGHLYSLRSLFQDDRRRVLQRVLESTRGESEATFRQLYEHNAPLMRFLAELGVPAPRAIEAAAEVIIGNDLRRELARPEPDWVEVTSLIEQATRARVQLDAVDLARRFEQAIEREAERLGQSSADSRQVQRLEAALRAIQHLPFSVDLWNAQNSFWDVLHDGYRAQRTQAKRGDAQAQAWLAAFLTVADLLRVRVPETVP